MQEEDVMGDLICDGSEFMCSHGSSPLKLKVNACSVYGENKLTANIENSFFPPPGGLCRLLLQIEWFLSESEPSREDIKEDSSLDPEKKELKEYFSHQREQQFQELKKAVLKTQEEFVKFRHQLINVITIPVRGSYSHVLTAQLDALDNKVGKPTIEHSSQIMKEQNTKLPLLTSPILQEKFIFNHRAKIFLI
jgi:hypothetical protein